MVTLEQFCYLPAHATRPSARFNFHYADPGMVAIFGDNGSGKSTLAQLIAGWYPDFLPGKIEGKGTLLGNPVGQLSLVEQSCTIQLVQQSPYLQLSGCTFSVEEEVAFGPENLCLDEAEIMRRIDAALTLTACQPLRHRHPGSLSGGETQRVVIASALAMQPKILILDEALCCSSAIIPLFSATASRRGDCTTEHSRHYANAQPGQLSLAERRR